MILPDTELQLPAARTFGFGANSTLGTYLATFLVTGTQLGGFIAQPFRVPVDYDRSREGRLFAWITNAAGVGPAAGNVRLEAAQGIATLNLPPVESTVPLVQAIPAAWPASNWMSIEIGSAAAPFFKPGSLGQDSIVGIRIVRNGPAATDTWTGSLGLLLNLVLRFHRLCQQCSCP